MPVLIRAAVLTALGCLAFAPPALAQSESPSSAPSKKVLYESGPSGRFLLDGTWLRRLDPGDTGLRSGWASAGSTDGWDRVTVPEAWNATDESMASYLGGVGWYRRDFRLPAGSPASASWVVRFESVNYAATVWLNGRRLAFHRGAYEPFEVRLPAGLVSRTGVNRLVLRVDTRRTEADIPPATTDARGRPRGGWWNYGGILREVYLRQVNDVDLEEVTVLPALPCATCAATVRWRVTARNLSARARAIDITGRFGTRSIRVGSGRLGPGQARTYTASLKVPRPKLWSPSRPTLYAAGASVSSGGTQLQSFNRRVGVRSITVNSSGRLTLNGKLVNLRGVGMHEDSRDRGFAVDNAFRQRQLQRVKDLGAGLVRAHYPLHPNSLEWADRNGLLVWSEVPVFQLSASVLRKDEVRRRAVSAFTGMVRRLNGHPSIAIWSVGNEMSSRVGSGQEAYIDAATAAARRIDPDRPIGIAMAPSPTSECQEGYSSLDVIGANVYYGWYIGSDGYIADRELLGPDLDRLRKCYPRKAVAITEFGFEANRDGAPEERGTYQFQRELMDYYMDLFDARPWLSGQFYWALQSFRVRPNWDGGNPFPQSPIHEKGVLDFEGNKRPNFDHLRDRFRKANQFGG